MRESKLKKKFFIKSWIALLAVMLISCASTPKFSGKGDLCGLVVDENNKPISDFVISCSKGGIVVGVGITNESGIFAISDVPAGNYEMNGEKVGWAKIVDAPFNFNSREKVFCCKVNSIKASIEAVEKQMECGDYAKALKLLDELCYEENTAAEVAILYYGAFASIRAGNKKSAEYYIRKLKKNKMIINKGVIQKLEDMANDIK